jgi:hypothetical protein
MTDSTIAVADSAIADTAMPSPGDSAPTDDTTPPADSGSVDTSAPLDAPVGLDASDGSVADSAEAATGSFTVGGTVAGLFSQDNLQLALNGSKQLFSPPDFTFAMPLANGAAYAVTVTMDPQTPIAETCTVSMGTGTVQGANVTDVAVKCVVNSYTIGGTVTGYSGTGLQLGDGTDTITVTATDSGTSSFVFPALASGEGYAVTVATPPNGPSEYCTVSASGTIGASNVTGVDVTCVPVPACSPSCTDGAGCVLSGDCASGVCSGGTCQAPACAPGCPTGAACGADGDCASGTCTVPTCQ